MHDVQLLCEFNALRICEPVIAGQGGGALLVPEVTGAGSMAIASDHHATMQFQAKVWNDPRANNSHPGETPARYSP